MSPSGRDVREKERMRKIGRREREKIEIKNKRKRSAKLKLGTRRPARGYPLAAPEREKMSVVK